MRLRHLALGTLRLDAGDRVATMMISEEMLRQTGLSVADAEGFAEMPISIQGVRASALLKEMPGHDYVKVSLRSDDDVDVCAVAREFGGGGHRTAAGCEMRADLESVRQVVVERLTNLLGAASRPATAG
jgi:phosphoesterase RecJ-like protein